ncbi:MBL fold metallo-hydrolase [Kordiimonas sp.]|uniref:MBL fold metallo-hydrolase n=1 Tax=Kordiimonas sp. TaxID=1970157 RepID=UPI003A8CD211
MRQASSCLHPQLNEGYTPLIAQDWHHGPFAVKMAAKQMGNFMKHITRAALFGAGLLMAVAPASATPIETIEVTEDFYILISNGLGANVGVQVGPDGVLLVDTMMERGNEAFDAALAAITDKSVRYVLNTHEHMDHNAGNTRFSEGGATLVYHKASPDLGLPRETRFSGTLSDQMAGTRVDIYTVVSHTMNDAIFHLPEKNVIFMGDTYATNWHPTFYGGGREGQLETIDLVLSLSDEATMIVPGHGPATGVAGLKQYRAAFTDWLDRMQQLVEAGQSEDQMADDAALQAIIARFQQEEGGRAIPENSFRRFIQRTIEREFTPRN